MLSKMVRKSRFSAHSFTNISHSAVTKISTRRPRSAISIVVITWLYPQVQPCPYQQTRSQDQIQSLAPAKWLYTQITGRKIPAETVTASNPSETDQVEDLCPTVYPQRRRFNNMISLIKNRPPLPTSQIDQCNGTRVIRSTFGKDLRRNNLGSDKTLLSLHVLPYGVGPNHELLPPQSEDRKIN